MGTTVSTNLSLIKPDINESIKQALPTFPGFASQNASNCNTIDALFRCSNGTYTPTLTCSSVNPTIGTGGFVEGKYIRLWPRMVFTYFRINFGTTGFAAGTGFYRMTIPFAFDATMKAVDNTRPIPVGKCVYNDANSILLSSVLLVNYEGNNDVVTFVPTAGSLLNATAIQASDQISGYFMYPTSDA